MSDHFVENCLTCKRVTSQCRCPSKDKFQRWTTCAECAKLCREMDHA